MDALRHVRLMADYNRWMNRRLYGSAATLTSDALHADRGAFFGSIFGTLNHVVVGDSLWLRRFAGPAHWDRLQQALAWLPDPGGLRDPMAIDLTELHALRERIDMLIVAWSVELKFNDLDRMSNYANKAGETRRFQLGPLLSHFFNHQTHHRGQVTTLLFQAGADPGPTDLVAMPTFDPFAASAAGAVPN